MFHIRQAQMDALVTGYQETFLQKLVKHLSDLVHSGVSERPKDFSTEDALVRLRNQVDYLLRHGFSRQKDIVEAIEFLELHSIDLGNEEIRIKIESNALSAEDKLYTLWEISRGGPSL